MYGKQEKKMTQQDMVLSVKQSQMEMEDTIDYESKRTNVDSAKKKSVLQRMDYEGFRQMVLGANLFSIKSREIMNFHSGKDTRGNQIFNASQTTFNNVHDLTMRNLEEVEQFNMIIAEQLQQSELIAKNFREFRKYFDRYYKADIDDVSAQTTYMFIKMQRMEYLKDIFCLEFEVSYFLKIMNLFNFMLKFAILPNQNYDEFIFIINFLEELTTIKDFKFSVPQFLSKKEKQELNSLIPLRQDIIQAFGEDKIPENFQKVEKFYIT